MAFKIQDGVWPTMITPFTQDNKVDFAAVEKICDWYVRQGCSGIFAVCQSSEMFYLSPEEKVDLARCVVRAVDGRIQVIASGHTASDHKTQLMEIEQMLKTGVQAYVLVSNRLDVNDEGDEVFDQNLHSILQAFPETAFGIYECPYPYKRLLSLPCLEQAVQEQHIVFLKDTCCDKELLRKRLGIVRNSPLRLFNANVASLLDSLEHGAAGYNGVMANFHPDLYVRMIELLNTNPSKARLLHAFLTAVGAIETRQYPACAKYHMALEGICNRMHTRSFDFNSLDTNTLMEVENLYFLEQTVRAQLNLLRG